MAVIIQIIATFGPLSLLIAALMSIGLVTTLIIQLVALMSQVNHNPNILEELEEEDPPISLQVLQAEPQGQQGL